MILKRGVSILMFCMILVSSINPQSVNAAEISVYRGNSYLETGKKLFYKTGKNSNTKLVTRNVGGKTEKTLDTIPVSNPFFVRSNYVYYETAKGISRVRDDGKKKLQLVSRKAQIIGFSGSYMYYKYVKGSTSYIARIKVNGENNKVLTKKPQIGDAVLALNRIYFISFDEDDRASGGVGFITNKADLSYVTLGGKVTKKIVTDVHFDNSAVSLDGNNPYHKELFGDESGVYFKYWIDYRTGKSVIYQLTAKGDLNVIKSTDSGEFYTLDSVTLLGVQNGTMYYHVQECLYSYSIAEGKEVLIKDLSKDDSIPRSQWAGFEIIIKGDWIFLTDGDGGKQTYYFKIDGTDTKYLKSYTWLKTLDITGNYMYYLSGSFKKVKL